MHQPKLGNMNANVCKCCDAGFRRRAALNQI